MLIWPKQNRNDINYNTSRFKKVIELNHVIYLNYSTGLRCSFPLILSRVRAKLAASPSSCMKYSEKLAAILRYESLCTNCVVWLLHHIKFQSGKLFNWESHKNPKAKVSNWKFLILLNYWNLKYTIEHFYHKMHPLVNTMVYTKY